MGFYLAASLPALLTAGLVVPDARCRSWSRPPATPGSWSIGWRWPWAWWWVRCSAYGQVGLDVMWTGIIGGTCAYGIHRLRGALR